MTRSNLPKRSSCTGDKDAENKAKNNEERVAKLNVQNNEVFSFKKHSMDYFTVDGVILRTGYKDKVYWYILILKELLDNAIDFLWKNYQGSEKEFVYVNIVKDDSTLNIKVRNSNSKGLAVFENLNLIFDFDMRYGSKQNAYVVNRGMLGDALKQILALGYVLIHSHDDGTAFTDAQWTKPLVVRLNGLEHQLTVEVSKANQTHRSIITTIDSESKTKDTEIELTLPIVEEFVGSDDGGGLVARIKEFCQTYALFTTDISFKFRIVDNSKDKPEGYNKIATDTTSSNDNSQDLFHTIVNRPTARKAAVNIEYLASDAISNWDNITSAHFYKAEEYMTCITNVHNKSISLYDLLFKHKFREVSNLPKDKNNQKSIQELLELQSLSSAVEQSYNQLRSLLPPPKELSLPYADNKQRKGALVSRVCNLYPEIDVDRAFYKVFRGYYGHTDVIKAFDHDGKLYTYHKGNGITQFPFAIEVLVVPYKTSSIYDYNTDTPINRSSKFIGAVNYAVSPRGISFDGDYSYWDKRLKYQARADSMKSILKNCQFTFHDYSDSKIKIPSIILVNLISPRIDYHGHDKSSIDTQPFAKTIIEAAIKISEKSRTFRAAGIQFIKERKFYAPPKKQKKMTAKALFNKFLGRIKTGGSLSVPESI